MVGAQRRVEVVDDGKVLHVVEAFVGLDDAVLRQDLLDLAHALFRQMHLLLLLVDPEVAVVFLRLLPPQQRSDAIDLEVEVGRFIGRARDDQRRARFVDQDRVDLVDDRVVQPALQTLRRLERHVRSQIVKSVFVVGAVGDVARIRLALGLHALSGHDDADVHAKRGVHRTHPGGVAPGQVIVDGDHMHALARQRIQVHRQCRHQRLALAGTHFRDLALVQHHATDQLHVVVAQSERAPGRLAHRREGLGQQLVLGLTGGQALAEFIGLAAQLLVAQCLEAGFELVDASHRLAHAADHAVVAATEDPGQKGIEHVGRWGKVGEYGGRESTRIRFGGPRGRQAEQESTAGRFSGDDRRGIKRGSDPA